MTKTEAGRLGGLATLRKYGITHYQTIGKEGFSTTVTKSLKEGWFMSNLPKFGKSYNNFKKTRKR